MEHTDAPGGAALEAEASSAPFESVWDALTDTPVQAANMRARSELMISITEVAETYATQKLAAEALGLTQPRLNDLLRGRIAKFSLDGLMCIAARAGLVVEVNVTKRYDVKRRSARPVPA